MINASFCSTKINISSLTDLVLNIRLCSYPSILATMCLNEKGGINYWLHMLSHNYILSLHFFAWSNRAITTPTALIPNAYRLETPSSTTQKTTSTSKTIMSLKCCILWTLPKRRNHSNKASMLVSETIKTH